MTTPKSKSLPWDLVENAINKEINWLNDTILEFHYNDAEKACRNCIYRRLALLILTGRIKAKDIKSSVNLFGSKRSLTIGKPHGKQWHFTMMKVIATYFKSLDYEVVIEPNLNMGRADLGIYQKSTRNLFIEVGTISLSKLLHNLSTMKGVDFLLVLDSKHVVEFSVQE